MKSGTCNAALLLLLDGQTKMSGSRSDVDKHMLSVDVLKKTDEIDKLAKQIRDEMKDSY